VVGWQSSTQTKLANSTLHLDKLSSSLLDYLTTEDLTSCRSFPLKIR